MRNPQLMIMLVSVLTFGFVSPGTSIQAAELEEPANRITLEKIVEFEDPQGEEVLVEPGTYSVTAGEETLSLTNNDSSTSVTIDADETSHKVEIPTPSAASIPGQDGPLANTHVVMLFQPDGHALQAIGTYPGIKSRGIPTETELPASPTTITFEKAVHFIAPDGSPVIADPGTYTAEVAEDWIRLVPGEERHNALLIEAQKGTNETEVEEMIALSLPGSTEQELDLHHMMLLLPAGHTLEATGSYSGIHPRNWFKRAFKKAKRTVHRTYKKARRTVRKAGRTVRKTTKRVGKTIGKTAKKVGKDVGRTAQKVGKGVGHAAKKVGKGVSKTAKQVEKGVGHAAKHVGKGVSQAALKAKYAAEQAAKFAAKQAKYVARQASIAACKTFFKAQMTAAKLQKKAFNQIQKGVNALRKNSKVVHNVIAAAEKFERTQKNLIDKAIKRALKFNEPQVLNKLKNVARFDNLCQSGVGGIRKKIKAVMNLKNQIRSRGIGSPVYNVGIQGAGTFKIGGLEGGAGLAFLGNFKNPTGYWFIGGTAQMPSAGGAIVGQAGVWNPKVVKTPTDVKGGYLAVGYQLTQKELSEHIYGYGNGYWANKEGALLNLVGNVDILFSWPNKKWAPNPIPAGVVVSLGPSGGLSSSGAASFVSKTLSRVNIQGGYGWLFKLK